MLSQTPSSSQVDARRVKKNRKKQETYMVYIHNRLLEKGVQELPLNTHPVRIKRIIHWKKIKATVGIEHILRSSIETATSTNFIAVNDHGDTRKQVESSFVFP